MIGVRGRLIVLEWLVVWDIIGHRRAANIRVSRGAYHPTCGRTGYEATLEPAPANALRVEQVADVLTRHRNSPALGGTGVIRGIGVVQIGPVQSHRIARKAKV